MQDVLRPMGIGTTFLFYLAGINRIERLPQGDRAPAPSHRTGCDNPRHRKPGPVCSIDGRRRSRRRCRPRCPAVAIFAGGASQDAIGKFLYQGNRQFPIVGVVADFHEGSFHETIKPVVIAKMPGREWSVAVKLTGKEKEAGDIKKILYSMEQEWKKIYPRSMPDGNGFHNLQRPA